MSFTLKKLLSNYTNVQTFSESEKGQTKLDHHNFLGISWFNYLSFHLRN